MSGPERPSLLEPKMATVFLLRMEEKVKKVRTTPDQIMRAWVKFPERWKQLWDACEEGQGRYTRGVFVVNGKSTKPPRKKTQGQIIAEMLKSEPMGYLS